MAANQTRNVFFERVSNLMAKNNDIVIVSVDLAGPPFDRIRKDYPDRYVGVGIAEQNSVAVACGLASTGKKVVVYAANPFPFLRAFDQIRNCACTMNLPITIVGLGTGFSVAECGTTHLTIEDIGLSSLCAGLDIFSVSDNDMAAYLADCFTSFTKPTYIRFGKWASETLGEFSDVTLNEGYRIVKEGSHAAIISTGCTVLLLKKMAIPSDVAIIDWFKLSDTEHICKVLRKYNEVLTVEEHVKRGGIGSLLLDAFNENGLDTKLKRMGIDLPNGYPQQYGDRAYWLQYFGITEENINNLLE